LAVRACPAVILQRPRIRRPRVSAPAETPWPILKERSVRQVSGRSVCV
jgi:hypothetical protein